MISKIFQLCVDLLVWLAGLLGMTYEGVNVWIFCVIWPVITLLLIAIVVYQCFLIRRLRRSQTGG